MPVNSALKIFAVSMIRNDGDIIWPFLSQAASLFDGLLVADVQSTDGSREAMEAFRLMWPHIRIFSFRHQEKHQAAITNCLTREAIAAGADWIFYLDADEFLNIGGRQALVQYLRDFPCDVMHMPWMNLVPSEYGTFAEFDIAQKFWWSGRVQPYNKVAVATSYFLRHPDFYVHEGNHHVSRNLVQHDVDWDENLGLALMHVPVRSAERLRYKISHALRTLDAKHNSQSGEGFHVRRIAEIVNDGRAGSGGLNVIAANYGINDDCSAFLEVERLGWPRKSLPGHVSIYRPHAATACSAQETARRDARTVWRPASFPRGSVVQGEIAGEILTLLPQPLTGRTELFRGRYGTLHGRRDQARDLTQAASESLRAMALDVVFGRGGEVPVAIPALAFMFGMVRPRRYVHLGTDPCEIFLSAVRATEQLGLGAQCIAVGAWDGDPRTCSDEGDVFSTFRTALNAHYPWQHYVQAHASEAVRLFEDGSIDVLYVGADASLKSGATGLDDWLPKMTDCGVVIRQAADPLPHDDGRTTATDTFRVLGLECLLMDREGASDAAQFFAALRRSGLAEIAEEILRSATKRLSADRACRSMQPELDGLRSETTRLEDETTRLQALVERVDGMFWQSRRQRSDVSDDLVERIDASFWQVKALACQQAAEILRLEQELRDERAGRAADQRSAGSARPHRMNGHWPAAQHKAALAPP